VFVVCAQCDGGGNAVATVPGLLLAAARTVSNC